MTIYLAASQGKRFCFRKDTDTGNWDGRNPNGVFSSLIDGFVVTPLISPVSPVKGVVVEQNEYRTSWRKITDDVDLAGIAGTPDFCRHEYSRRQAYNCDGTLIRIVAESGYHMIYDATTLEVTTFGSLTPRPVGWNTEAFWHPTIPERLIFTGANGGGLIYYWRDVTSTTSVQGIDWDVYFDLTDLAAIYKNQQPETLSAGSAGTSLLDIFPSAQCAWTGSEGQPSEDHDIWLLAVENYATNYYGLICYKKSTNTIISYLNAADTVYFGVDKTTVNASRPNHVSTAPSGRVVVPSWNGASPWTTGGTFALNPNDLSLGQKIHHLSAHSDLGIAKDGSDLFVASAYQNGDVYPLPHDGNVVYAKMDCSGLNKPTVSLHVRADLDAYIAGPNGIANTMHFSGKAVDKPGWFVLSSYSKVLNSPPGYLDNMVFMIDVEGTEIRKIMSRMSETSASVSYWLETQATCNRDLTRVLFATDFGLGSSNDAATVEVIIDPFVLPA